MSNLNDTGTGVLVLLSGTSLAHAVFHTYKYDKWRCLVPRRKEWFRVLLTWMLILGNVAMFAWGLGWAIVKYHLGWVTLPEIGAIPVPPPMFPPRYRHWNVPLSVCMNVGYSLQASLNAEEGLYWYHLMRAVRQPKSARGWLNSPFFYAWIAISVVCTAVQCSVGWIRTHGDQNLQIARELVCGGVIEMVVVVCASIVLVKFPSFLRDVKASGAGPDVRSRLHYYHEANKVRTFFRFIFAGGILTLGLDRCTKKLVINSNPRISDPLIQLSLSAFFFVLMISMMLYLPRSYSSIVRANQVMVAPQPVRQIVDVQLASGNALMSLLREGGHWDEDDDLRAGATQSDNPLVEIPRMWSVGNKNNEESWENEERPSLPVVIQNFSSPIAIQRDKPYTGPIRVHVQREVLHE